MSLIDKKNIFLLEEIVKKNFSSKYKDSVLGIFWTVLSPLLMMILFTIIFSTLFKSSIENFYVYFLSGWCIFQFFSSSINVSMDSLKGNKNILQKTPAPKHIFILGSIISEFLTYLIMLMILGGVILLTNAPLYWSTIPFIIIPIFSLIMMLIGLGLILAIARVYYTDIKYLWTVVSMMLLYASAIFYPIEIIPEPYRSYMILNPVFVVIDQFRCFVYKGILPQGISMINLVLLSLIILVLGIIIFKRFENKVTTKF